MKSKWFILNTIIYLILFSLVFTENITNVDNKNDIQEYQMSTQRYQTDSNGNILMYVNVWGHVNSPGNHLVYDGIDLVTLLSIVGGPRKGANLKKVRLLRETPDVNGLISYELDLNDFFKHGSRNNLIEIKPNDTVVFTETKISYILSQIGSVSTFLQIVNLYFQLASK